MKKQIKETMEFLITEIKSNQHLNSEDIKNYSEAYKNLHQTQANS